jgi:hypothetical protein
MKSARRRWLVVGFLSLVVIGWAMGQYDYARLVAGRRPVFARFFSANCADGGSVQYFGLGYTVTELHEIRVDTPPDVPAIAPSRASSSTPFRVGQALNYWTPFVSREETRYVVETNK